MVFDYLPKGPFDLANQNKYFGGWPTLLKDPKAIVLAFPVEGWKGSAAVTLSQNAAGRVIGQVYGQDVIAEKAKQQALACLSLDIAAEDWPLVGHRDAVIGELQKKYRFLRPILFHSPYEAAAGFIIGHRTTIKQKQAMMKRMSDEIGEKIMIDGQVFHAFPDPQTLLTLTSYQGLGDLKIERLHGVAEAALNGELDRGRLLSQPVDQALARLRSISGIGPFFAQGILHRGAGLVDAVTDDDLTQYAVQAAYQLAKLPSHDQVLEIADLWKPFRMWTTVLLHVWLRREVGLPRKRTFTEG
jgi:DNA-3-methyladenine glycosylase II